MRTRTLFRWLGAASLAAAGMTASAPAQAHGNAAIVMIPMLADAVFTVYDFAAFASEEHSKGWVTVQAILTTPQAVLIDMEPFTDGHVPLFLHIWLNQLSAFGIYGLASPRVSTTALYGLSWAIGFDTALTAKTAALALQGEWSPRAIAITQLVAATPQLIVAGYALAVPEDLPRQREAALALGGWSSAILVHGVASLILYRPKPAPKPPKQAWQLAPSALQGERGLAPGLAAFGTF